MNAFEKWMLRRIYGKLMRQSYVHRENIVATYRIIATTIRDNFPEDNMPTIREFLNECHGEALNSVLLTPECK